MIDNLPAGVYSVGVHLPERERRTRDVFGPVAKAIGVNPRYVERATGVACTRVSEDYEDAADLAVMAGRKALDGVADLSDITLILYCGMSKPYVEPSVAYECAEALGLSSGVECFDLSNACAGFATGIRQAALNIHAGLHKKVLLVAGETGSSHTAATNSFLLDNPGAREHLDKYLASYTLGDIGAAMVMGPAQGAPMELRAMSMQSDPANRSLCNIAHAHAPLVADAVKMMDVIAPQVRSAVSEMIEAHQLTCSGIAKYFVHQTGKSAVNKYFDWFKLASDQLPIYYDRLGNLISCSFPAALAMEWQSLSKGDLCLGSIQSSGTSVSVQLFKRN